ncbi:hypothetical protein [Nitrosomonas aestuarii]|uniref:hypothetical protein n=1 Tax=Nitrosomonas aestuarii TaxID=52441 RepID=UPI000D2F8D88|nr:hypothetical protein [Nitrosomonas aestuarii]PTN13314.1 hypothetical protein C8R11_101307 [Nitrosomonas aestuarii]
MFCYIKEWPNKMATLMTADGVVLCTCQNADEAKKVWHDWKQQQKPQAPGAAEAELEILPYSPTISDWLKGIVSICYAGMSKKVVNE